MSLLKPTSTERAVIQRALAHVLLNQKIKQPDLYYLLAIDGIRDYAEGREDFEYLQYKWAKAAQDNIQWLVDWNNALHEHKDKDKLIKLRTKIVSAAGYIDVQALDYVNMVKRELDFLTQYITVLVNSEYLLLKGTDEDTARLFNMLRNKAVLECLGFTETKSRSMVRANKSNRGTYIQESHYKLRYCSKKDGRWRVFDLNASHTLVKVCTAFDINMDFEGKDVTVRTFASGFESRYYKDTSIPDALATYILEQRVLPRDI